MAKKDKEHQKESMKGWFFTLAAMLLGVKTILADVFNIEIPFSVLGAVIGIVLSLAGAFGAYRHNYLGPTGESQYNLLKNSGLDHFYKDFLEMFKRKK